eukprot:TRINITY_DN10187_c0_g1_i1.p1 TRINITY_DN10187_c0_g1~~TRINITY_DN10187_c0_g1_i1.p1  ORF type:complete len:162 (+),score=35.40 TRINITY_DN10187_c0_g1_i1:793-1278(+)
MMSGYISNSNFGEEHVDLTFPKKSWSKLDELEENERSDRILRGIDPILHSKMLKVRQEVISKGKSEEPGVISHVWDDVMRTANFVADDTNRQFTTWFDQAAVVVENAIAKVGLGKPGSMALEEHERERRLHAKIDPIIAARKHSVESEILDHVNFRSLEPK